ncbi:MAG: transcription-repair coupling factor [Candidatus Tectomicrobia bacterium]|nr:transcription-repair coupling factor [Candidatus Tectomicrobia bacterium]
MPAVESTFVESTFESDIIRPRPQVLHGSRPGGQGFLLASLFVERRTPMIVVTPDASRRDELIRDLQCFLDNPPGSLPWFPDSGVVLGYIPEQQETPRKALQADLSLWRLRQSETVIVVAAAASLRYGTAPEMFGERLMTVQIGNVRPLPEFATALVGRGYRRTSMVEAHGEFAMRGGILDVFSPGERRPWRLEFFGDEVETIRNFEVDSQLSVDSLNRVVIAPLHGLPPQNSETASGWERLRMHLRASNWSDSRIGASFEHWRQQHPASWPWGLDRFFAERLQSPLEDLPATVTLCCVDSEDVHIALDQLPAPLNLQLGDSAVPAAIDHFATGETLNRQLRGRTDIALPRYHGFEGSNGWAANGSQRRQSPSADEVTELRMRGTPAFSSDLGRFVSHVKKWHEEPYGVLVFCRSAAEAQRLQDALSSYDLDCGLAETAVQCLTAEAVPPGSTLLALGTLSHGFVRPDKRLVVLHAGDLFGDKHRAAEAPPARSGHAMKFVGTLRPGDLVVHSDHGIGRFDGMTFLGVDCQGGEFMEVIYADNAKLYVPSYRLSLVEKYRNGSGEGAKTSLDRLGTTSWARTKAKVKTALLDMAGELVSLHASRRQNVGHHFSASTTLHQEFENGFEYVETDDQLLAIQDVLSDMERPRPMERLVCGDVGYGKTEVALRAAFKSVFDGKQVAVLVPTTVLAQQHAETFRKRFEAFGARVAMLSRLNSRKEQTGILRGLQEGTIQVVIGTHRLLQKDIQFKDLGLLVVDEEHRFGVGHKERIKRMSVGTDVLILTATPIPRSLQMALTGLRDCTIMGTPPGGRSAIETVIMPFSEETIEGAVRQELARQGQVFFVHNHIASLPVVHSMLNRLVPECRVRTAHGQMPERQLESVMLDFLRRDFDLLLCTTIIESGLDIPSVNTIIVNNADNFGLAQMHQLRGRVGRGLTQAYAYLLIPGETLLSGVARQRIEALEEFSQLGSGFHLASRDLEIRGAGNLLGPQQSGHMNSVGFDLYCQMMAEAVSEAKGEAVAEWVEPELRLGIQGHIPGTYVENETQRLQLYRRLSAATSKPALEELQIEMQDRFGILPEPTRRLLEVLEIKILARALGLERIQSLGTRNGSELRLTFHPSTSLAAEKLLPWLESHNPGFRFQSEHVVCIPETGGTPAERLQRLKGQLQRLYDGDSIKNPASVS